MFSLAFYGLFRVGELVVDSGKSISIHALRFSDVTFVDTGVQLLLRSSKTDQYSKGVVIHIQGIEGQAYAVRSLKSYTDLRASIRCPFLFCHMNGLPLS